MTTVTQPDATELETVRAAYDEGSGVFTPIAPAGEALRQVLRCPGFPTLVEAEKEGLTPRELADRYNRVIAEDFVALGLSYDLSTRTTTRNHYAVAQELFSVADVFAWTLVLVALLFLLEALVTRLERRWLRWRP